ncbi:MAG: Asp-tRNA(Asn)/Glu-tRNA(Gln) amidotransferase GatCAB subunit A, partial [Legionella sp.]
MDHRTLTQWTQALQKSEISSVELTQHFLQQIAKHQDLNAFISTDAEHALQEAAKADVALKKGQKLNLLGIPMALKDLYCTQRMTTTCGSKMLANFQAPYTATIA